MSQFVLCLFCLHVTHFKLAYQSQHHIDGSSGLKRAVPATGAAQVSYGNFVADKFQRLQVSIGSSTAVMNYRECAMNCVNTPPCVSFNVASSPDVAGKFRCELLNEDKYTSLNQLIGSQEYHHFSIKISCSSYPCKNNGKCVANYGDNKYHCDCGPGYVGTHCETENWKKLNSVPVCYGARDDAYGTFKISEAGFIIQLTLTHITGSIACSDEMPPTYWGCDHPQFGKKSLATLITFQNKTRLLPVQLENDPCTLHYGIDGVNFNSTTLSFDPFAVPLRVAVHDGFQIWFGQDYQNCSELNNGGQICVDVHAWYA